MPKAHVFGTHVAHHCSNGIAQVFEGSDDGHQDRLGNGAVEVYHEWLLPGADQGSGLSGRESVRMSGCAKT